MEIYPQELGSLSALKYLFIFSLATDVVDSNWVKALSMTMLEGHRLVKSGMNCFALM
jgi:hypothetical protein